MWISIFLSDIEDGEHVHFEDGSDDEDDNLENSLTIMNIADLDVEEKESVRCASASSNSTGKIFIETSGIGLATGASSWASLKWSDLIDVGEEKESIRSA
jgi:hypothetical protein